VSVGGARLVLDQAVLRGETVLAKASVTVALLGANGRAERLPADLRAAFAAAAAKP
jgi:acyl-CoA thioester hydrolase